MISLINLEQKFDIPEVFCTLYITYSFTSVSCNFKRKNKASESFWLQKVVVQKTLIVIKKTAWVLIGLVIPAVFVFH